jgi:hypothetical protein
MFIGVRLVRFLFSGFGCHISANSFVQPASRDIGQRVLHKQHSIRYLYLLLVKFSPL